MTKKNKRPQVRVIPMGSAARIRETYQVMKHLRPHLSEKAYGITVKQMAPRGFRLAVVEQAGKITCVAGYRISRSLAWGKFLYVDDLVTDPTIRSKGHGKLLLGWLLKEAKKDHCEQLHLDSGIQRRAAHRFYRREKMDMTCLHFTIKLR